MDEIANDNQNKTLMDGVDRGAYDEWSDHPATKLLLGQLKEDIAACKEIIVTSCQGSTIPDALKLAALGAQLSARQALLAVATERSDG